MAPLNTHIVVGKGLWIPLALQWRRARSSFLSGITGSVGHGRARLKEMAELA